MDGLDRRSDGECLDDLIPALRALEGELESRRLDADPLNVFEVLGITDAEIRHSNMLAWLMRPDGSHRLGGVVTSSLVARAGGRPPEDASDFRVTRETGNIDILAVSARNHMTLAVENKVWSGEHDDQLARYRSTVERRYPGWAHLFLFLSPLGIPPEGDEDRRLWVPISYREVVSIVEGAMAEADVPDKARMLIGDYVDSVRRHIVGDESLRERCVEVYLEHRRAIDLIMANLPDTTKTAHQFVLEWARRQPGVSLVESCSRGRQFVRFRTRRLEEAFPAIEGTDGWGQRHFWFYEAITRPSSDGVGCDLSLQISFHLPEDPPVPEERAEAVRSFVESFSGGDDGSFHGAWTGFSQNVANLGPTELDYEVVSECCDVAWAGFLKREERALGDVRGLHCSHS